MRSKRACWASLTLALMGLALGATAQEPPPPDPALQRLLAQFQRSAGGEARFVEEKHMALLAAPLASEGTIYFAPPGLLARHTTAPSASRLLITPDKVVFADRHGAETIRLSHRPVVRSFVESFVTLLRGDYDALTRRYDMTLTIPKAAGHWQLTLRPRGGPMARVFERLVVQGYEATVDSFVTHEVGGDRTVIRFSAINPARTFTEEERRTLFSVSGAAP